MPEPVKVSDNKVEEVSRVLHSLYQNEVKRQEDVIRHPDDYDDLSEKTKNYDRVLARYILEREKFSLASRDQEIMWLRAEIGKAEKAIDWISQTVHRAYHDGTLEDCRKNTCDFARQALSSLRAVVK